MRNTRLFVAVDRTALGAAMAASLALVGCQEASEGPLPGPDEPSIADTIEQMTLEEKVGQLFVANVYGDSGNTAVPEDIAANHELYGPEIGNANQLIAKYKLGGIIYFRWANNLNEPTQIASLSNDLQEAALAQRSKIPLLVSTDQEHGVVTRVWAPATEFPGAMALGAGRSADDVSDVGTVTGQELRALGINQNYAPVADVNVNPANPVIGVRSFSEDPQLTADLTAAATTGMEKANVAATIKHFPGHGDTVTDSHTGVPWIFHTKEEWQTIDAPPFAAGIAAGVDMIMTAHVVMPKLQTGCDAETGTGCDPATLAPEILTDLLRGELGYDGVVITDALNMAGVREKYGDDRVPVLALKAGVDMLMMVDQPTDTVSLDVAYGAVLAAVRAGEISEERIDQSVFRILRLKRERDLFDDPLVDASKAASLLGRPDSLAVADRVADHSVTLVRNDEKLLPVSAGKQKILVTGYRSVSDLVQAQPAFHLANAIAGFGATPDLFETGKAPDAATIDAAVMKANTSDLIVIATSNASGKGESAVAQRALVDALRATGKPVVVVGTRNPYDIAELPDVTSFLATYSWTKPSMEAAVRVLFGDINPVGKLPVRIPAADGSTVLYPFGHGLNYK